MSDGGNERVRSHMDVVWWPAAHPSVSFPVELRELTGDQSEDRSVEDHVYALRGDHPPLVAITVAVLTFYDHHVYWDREARPRE